MLGTTIKVIKTEYDANYKRNDFILLLKGIYFFIMHGQI